MRTAMPKPPDFENAHRRHMDDADRLYARDRFANADHLYGLGAECGLKAVMLERGVMSLDRSGKPEPKKYMRHIDELWPEFRQLAGGRQWTRDIRRMADPNPFADWSIDDRYANERCFDKATASPHREAAEVVARMVEDRAVARGAAHE